MMGERVVKAMLGLGMGAGLLLLCTLAKADAVADVIRLKLEKSAGAAVVANPAAGSQVQALTDFYAERNWAPVWSDSRYQALLTQLADLYTDGLNPEDYAFSRLERARKPDADPTQAAERDMLATQAYLLALQHLYRGKVDPVRLDSEWNFAPRQQDPALGLRLAREAVERNDVASAFRQARPELPQYNSTRTALARFRSIALEGGWPSLPAGPSLKPGMADGRVPLLRQRMQIAGLLPYAEMPEPELYDDELRQAVQRFQQEAYLEADGAVGASTLAALNVPVGERIGQIRANLERMRWFLHEVQGDFVIVDIAGYRIAYVSGSQIRWQSRVQVGKAYRSTPAFKSSIRYLTLSPGWVVPPTIFKEDALPAIRRDIAYLARNRMKVFDAAGRELDPAAVDWRKPGNITLRQEPGPGGALGELVIRFANPYSIYLHDTPHKELFGGSQRATSSGCIRVENIHELALLLLDDEDWTREALQAAIDERKTRNVTLKKKVPILLVYWTLDVGDDGYVSFKPDIYQRDAAVLQALNEKLPVVLP